MGTAGADAAFISTGGAQFSAQSAHNQAMLDHQRSVPHAGARRSHRVGGSCGADAAHLLAGEARPSAGGLCGGGCAAR